MFEQSSSEIPSSSIWSSMNSWFTPAVFFVLLNLMIGTIAITSTFTNTTKKQNQNQNQHEAPKNGGSSPPSSSSSSSSSSPPSVLQRLKSSNFYPYFRSQDPQLSSIYKPTPDTDTLFNPELHYFFQDNVQSSQAREQGPPEAETHLISGPKYTNPDGFGPPHDEPPPEAETHLISSPKYSSPDGFGPAHDEPPPEAETHLISGPKYSDPDGFGPAHDEPPPEAETHLISGPKDSNPDGFGPAHDEKVEEPPRQSMDEVYSQLAGGGVNRTKSGTVPASGEIPAKLPARMKKSASVKSAFGHFGVEEEPAVEARRPATVREKGSAKATDGDEGVDAKADDFINRFKQQLKLQRLDSIIRYKDMIGRGSG